MKTITSALIAAALALSGCRGLDRLTGTEKKDNPRASAFYIVAGCMDNNETGHPTFPTFLPVEHVDLIKRVKAACRTNDCQIGGDTWLAVGTDCGKFMNKIGDEYYAGRGY